ncbi:ribonuclease [Citromicrobium sp. RCC1885]|uniref:ribonuclease n=1 Tax=unclassified Citromicrobium TaxID=2630544 RepID=UPI0006C91B44|nr:MULTISPECIES: ribonuclease [unclassified Citromicrobium]KPM23127.1 ribonuclease [Citromicrobium sp. RCC1885]KPM26534.1 ribonuclease [Citromicrobium sp. RCC1878]MAO04012.1 ribonuclease [Citromicrobium sp.]OAM08953.1 ribonuclease [Citromicrobium sp. RCC1897]
MAEWLVERGIGETRWLLIEDDRVFAARLHWPEDIALGPATATLTRRIKGASRGLARTGEGVEINVSGLPKDASEGSTIPVLLTRAPIAERGRLKRAQGVYQRTQTQQGGTKARSTEPEGTQRRFPPGLWEDVWTDAWEGEIAFAGGSLIVSPAPAMTVIDIDGDLPPRDLALAAVPALAETLRRFDLAGSIGIDFPTLAEKAQRRAVDEALEQALSGWPHERTAMNGFGFVQLVARLERPSLLHRLHLNRASAAARMLLRRAELTDGIGPRLLLRAHPAVADRLSQEWLAELARRSGRKVEVERDPALALEAGHAQILAS